ncbi:hypothetical protein Syun_006863 [Stephania yunnanensis]|uniref:Uncharacterized protein n=1 Tax=Stephania yunnanensis TaxID=152371 RepID=A0AAP0PXY4_9MAGN
MKIDVNSEKSEKPQIESEENQPLVLVQPPTLPCTFGKPYKGVEVRERLQIFYTVDTFVFDDPGTIDSFVLKVPDEFLNLKEGVHVSMPKYVDASFVIDISKGEGITYGDAASDNRVCLDLPRLCDPDPVAPAFGGLRLLGLLSILFPLTLILVVCECGGAANIALHTSHDQQLQKIIRWLRAHVTPSSSTSTALVIQAGCVFTVHNPPEKLLVQARPAVTEVTHVRSEIVPPIPETPAEDTPSTSIDTGVKATVEVRRAREF